jgi:hypothetical protein
MIRPAPRCGRDASPGERPERAAGRAFFRDLRNGRSATSPAGDVPASGHRRAHRRAQSPRARSGRHTREVARESDAIRRQRDRVAHRDGGRRRRSRRPDYRAVCRSSERRWRRAVLREQGLPDSLNDVQTVLCVVTPSPGMPTCCERLPGADTFPARTILTPASAARGRRSRGADAFRANDLGFAAPGRPGTWESDGSGANRAAWVIDTAARRGEPLHERKHWSHERFGTPTNASRKQAVRFGSTDSTTFACGTRGCCSRFDRRPSAPKRTPLAKTTATQSCPLGHHHRGPLLRSTSLSPCASTAATEVPKIIAPAPRSRSRGGRHPFSMRCSQVGRAPEMTKTILATG